MDKTKEEVDIWKEVAVKFSELYNRGPAILLPTQRMFPNCSKYKKCCTEDSEWWARLQVKISAIEFTKQPFRVKNVERDYRSLVTPEGFEEHEPIKKKSVDWEEKEKHGV